MKYASIEQERIYRSSVTIETTQLEEKLKHELWALEDSVIIVVLHLRVCRCGAEAVSLLGSIPTARTVLTLNHEEFG